MDSSETEKQQSEKVCAKCGNDGFYLVERGVRKCALCGHPISEAADKRKATLLSVFEAQVAYLKRPETGVKYMQTHERQPWGPKPRIPGEVDTFCKAGGLQLSLTVEYELIDE